ncbi:MAG: GNAT family N-acetyltransferase, partial [Opitutaceae bacterium]
IFEQYRSEFRARSLPGYALEVFPDLSRHTAEDFRHEGHVGFANLSADTAGERIYEQIRHFDRLEQPFEWKVHDFDQPATLKAMLEARGFGCGDAEAFLVATLQAWPESEGRRCGARIERITDAKGIRDFIAVEEAVWQEAFPTHFARYTRALNSAPDITCFYCAYVADQPVAAGRILLPAGSSFASLWSGSVLPEMRGRGVYSALLAQRIAMAKSHGYRFVTVDAEPMSRPILLKRGFEQVCWTYPMRRRS